MKKIISMCLAVALLMGVPVLAVPAAIDYGAECVAEDFAFHALTAEKADGIVSFVLSYESGIERTISIFNPPQGSLISVIDTLEATNGVGTFSFQFEEANLANADYITLKVFGNEEEAMNNSIILSFAVDDTLVDKSLATNNRVVIGIAKLSESGHYMIPIRAVCESEGAEVGWDGETKTVTVSYDGVVVTTVTVGSSIAKSGSGEEVDLGEVTINDNGTVYICGDMFLGSTINVDPDTLEVYTVVAIVQTTEPAIYTPTPEAYTSNLTEKGTGLARKVPANEVVMTEPLTLSERSYYARWVWTDTGEADIRWLDTKTNLSEQEQALIAKCAPNITFNTDTVFPDNMPEGYDPAAILEAGKDPGLGVRALHENSVTGAGVGIAIIDQILYTDHPEYKDKLALYEEIHILPDEEAAMHGSAVASIAVGESTGVAPGAKLYYWGLNLSRSTDGWSNLEANIAFGEGLAVAVDRVIEVNESLPVNEKIRVISISRGFSDLEDEGVQAFLASVKRAEDAGIFVITTSTNACYDWLSDEVDLAGLGKLDLGGDADDLSNYTLGTWQQFEAAYFTSKLLVPMDARTVADYTEGDGYAFYADGGWSWAVPYLAGVYALACQSDPSINPEHFWELALQTSSSITVPIQSPEDVAYGREGTEYKLEHVINPTALIEAIKAE